MTESHKLYCIVSKEAVEASKGVRGKMASQCGHAYLGAYLDSAARFPQAAQAYLNSGVVAKITLIAEEKQLHELAQFYKNKHGVFLVKDAGITVFPRPMITALGIGPMLPSERDEVLANLKTWT